MPVRDYQIEVRVRSPVRMENEGCYINDFNLTECDTEYQYNDS